MREVFMQRSIGAAAQFSHPRIVGGAGILLTLSAACTVPAHAQDSWGGADKRAHATFSCFFGAGAAAWQRESPGKAWLIAMIPGTVKEAADATTATGTGWSWKDIGANALGAGLCVSGARVLLRHSEGRTEATFRVEY